MNHNEFTQLSKLLPKTIHHYNLNRQVKGAVICHQFRMVAEKLWNESVDESMRPRSFKDGMLLVDVRDSGWAQQVQFKRAVLLERLREQCPEMTIKGLRIKVSGFSG